MLSLMLNVTISQSEFMRDVAGCIFPNISAFAAKISDIMLTPKNLLGLPRSAKRAIALSIDVLICIMSVCVAYYLRTNDWPEMPGPIIYPIVVSVSVALPLFSAFGLYRAIFRYTGSDYLLKIVEAVVIYLLPFAFVFTYLGVLGVPRTIGLIQPAILLILVAASRATVAAWLGWIPRVASDGKAIPRVLIYGAGMSGRQIASALQVSHQVKVIGFLDDDRTLWKSTINGHPVYAPEELPRLVECYAVTDVLLAINKTARLRRNEIISQLKKSGLHIRIVPGVDQLARGTVSFSDLKDLDIEDLLGRAPISPDTDLLGRNIVGKVVLVTGAGGSIGSEICRQIGRIGADILLLVESSEYNLYTIHQELLQEMAGGQAKVRSLVPLLANVRDHRRIDEILAAWKPHTIYHAAAFKHVPLVEHNVLEGLANNVLGTLNVANAARRHSVASFVLISTDKAVRPTNTMGATKRLAEIVLQAMHDDGLPGMFCMVRFGNVLGSSGSVVPLFRSQIASGGPITITHPEITRYFMTIPEAAQLVIQAGAMATGGDVFVLDMGEPVKIVDLARVMIELSGFKPGSNGNEGEIAIDFVGLRPGEKLYEELLIGNDPSPSAHPRILRAHEPFLAWSDLRIALALLEKMINEGDAAAGRALLRDLVVEFDPMCDVVDYVALRQEENNFAVPQSVSAIV